MEYFILSHPVHRQDTYLYLGLSHHVSEIGSYHDWLLSLHECYIVVTVLHQHQSFTAQRGIYKQFASVRGEEEAASQWLRWSDTRRRQCRRNICTWCDSRQSAGWSQWCTLRWPDSTGRHCHLSHNSSVSDMLINKYARMSKVVWLPESQSVGKSQGYWLFSWEHSLMYWLAADWLSYDWLSGC